MSSPTEWSKTGPRMEDAGGPTRQAPYRAQTIIETSVKTSITSNIIFPVSIYIIWPLSGQHLNSLSPETGQQSISDLYFLSLLIETQRVIIITFPLNL